MEESSSSTCRRHMGKWNCLCAYMYFNIYSSRACRSSLQPVLKSVNLVVHPGEKIALCGRTGR